jgi:uridine kinase
VDVLGNPIVSHELADLVQAPIFLDSEKRQRLLDYLSSDVIETLDDLPDEVKQWLLQAQQELADINAEE